MTDTYTSTSTKVVHPWLHSLKIAYTPGVTSPLLDEFAGGLLASYRELGHQILPSPQPGIDILFTTAPFGEALSWRQGYMFTARMKFHLEHTPSVVTILEVTPEKLQEMLDYLAGVLKKSHPEPADYPFPGLASEAYLTLYEQGCRGGPILALLRILQTQAKCIRLILVVGHNHPEEAYIFDLVGAYPRITAEDPLSFYDDIALRIATSISSGEVTEHEESGDPIPWEVWQSLTTPPAMIRAGHLLGERHFFTEMVRIANLANVPSINDAVSSQYSEGCFSSWEPKIGVLISTVTGSARPVEKYNLTDNELAVISGVRPDGKGALVRHVEGKRNDPPSSEAVEMIAMDGSLPRIRLGEEWGITDEVPVTRSKLHGHRGVQAYNPIYVENVYLDPPYYHFPVSCGSDAQARAIQSAFSRSASLNNPDDPRRVAFVVLPGHGVMITEKWVAGKAPFQLIWEYMDSGYLEITKLIPQGPLTFLPAADGRMILREGVSL